MRALDGTVTQEPYYCHMCVAETGKQAPLHYFPILIPFFVTATVAKAKKKHLTKWTLTPREVCIPHARRLLKELKPNDLLPPGTMR